MQYVKIIEVLLKKKFYSNFMDYLNVVSLQGNILNNKLRKLCVFLFFKTTTCISNAFIACFCFFFACFDPENLFSFRRCVLA